MGVSTIFRAYQTVASGLTEVRYFVTFISNLHIHEKRPQIYIFLSLDKKVKKSVANYFICIFSMPFAYVNYFLIFQRADDVTN